MDDYREADLLCQSLGMTDKQTHSWLTGWLAFPRSTIYSITLTAKLVHPDCLITASFIQ